MGIKVFWTIEYLLNWKVLVGGILNILVKWILIEYTKVLVGGIWIVWSIEYWADDSYGTCKWSSNCLPGLKYIGSLQGSGTAQMQDSCLHKKYTLYTFVNGSHNSDHSALIKSVFKKICVVTCTSSSPLCPGFLPQVSCLDILSEFPRKIQILRYFAVLAKSLAPKTKFGLLPKRVRINKEQERRPFFNDTIMAFWEIYLLWVLWFITNCDILGGEPFLDHQVSYVQLKRYEG